MKIKLLKAYQMSAPGDILPNVNKPVADLLVKRGIAEIVIVKKKKSNKKAKKND